MGRWCGNCEGKGSDGTLRGKDERVFDHGAGAGVVFGILHLLDMRLVCKSGNSCVAGFVIFDHVHRRLQSLIVNGRGEGKRVIESKKNTNVQELVF